MIFPLCSGRVTRGQTSRGETDRPTGKRRVDRDRRLNDAATGAGGVVERTEKLLAAREREAGGPSALQNFNSGLSVRSFRRREPPPSVRKVRFVRIRLPSSSSQVDDKNAGRTEEPRSLSLSFFRRHNFNFSKLRLPPPPRASGSKLSLRRTRPICCVAAFISPFVLMPLGSVADCCYGRPACLPACLPACVALRRCLCFS